MKELEQILRLWDEIRSAGDSAVLATVVKTQGSSYRRPGARLLLNRRGQRAGSISGGCLEDDVIKKSRWLTEGGPIIRRYDTNPDGEIGSGGFGMGCSGIVNVLLERVGESGGATLDLLREVKNKRRAATVAHVLEPVEWVGQRLIIDPAGTVTHNLANTQAAEAITSAARASTLSRVERLGSGAEVFFETLTPAVRLLVFGAGDDAVPLTDLASYLGWQVFVFDGRAHYARREKFPHAEEVTIRDSEEPGDGLAIDPWTVAVVMTHSYRQDLNNVRTLASAGLTYLGILGPRNRTERLLAEAGVDADSVKGLRTPMGLDIGADGPEQVALAVIAEIQATLNGRGGGLLKDRSGSIHARDTDGASAQSWLRSIVCA